MIVLHNEIYNPKIDYLICEKLVKTLPEDYDEDKIRMCYVDHTLATEVYEQDVISIKKFFEQNDILQITNHQIEELYKICAHEDIWINENIAAVLQSDMYTVAKYVNGINCQRKILFQILFLVYFCIKNNSPVIPYQSLCNKLFYAITAKEYDEVTLLYNMLQNRTHKYTIKHFIKDGEICVRSLYENKERFLTETDAIRIGYYGSYARGNANEYSDFDILAVFSDEKNLSLCKRKSIEFWRSIMPIEIDVAVVNISNIESLSKGIKRSIKFI